MRGFLIMSNLLKLRQVLEETKPNHGFNYAIPGIFQFI